MTDPASPFAEELQEAIDILQFVLDHPDHRFYLAVIFGAAQDHILEWLETVFYLVFRGPPGSGKSTAIAAAMALCRDGRVLGSATGPYLRDTLGSGRAVGISELGALLKENSQILAVVRNGNHRGTAIVGLKVPKKKGAGWDSVDVDTFGFKAMDAHGDLDHHTLDRSLVFDMVPSKSLNVAMDAEYLKERLAPVREMIARRTAQAKRAGWDAARVKATWADHGFRRRVARFGNAWGRHGLNAAHLLLINDIFEFGVEDDLRALMAEQEPELSDDAQLLKEVIVDWAEFQGDSLKGTSELLVSAELLRLYNATREERRIAWK